MLLAVFSAVDYCKHGYDTLVLDLLAIFFKNAYGRRSSALFFERVSWLTNDIDIDGSATVQHQKWLTK